MIQRMPRHADPQFPGVGPIQLHHFTGTMLLGKDHLRCRAVFQPPLPDPPLERSQLAFLHRLRPADHQMFKQRLGLKLGRRLQMALGLGPNAGQRIHPRSPRPTDEW